MKKQQIALLLSWCWAIGLVAVFSFPPKIKVAEQWDFQQTHVQEKSNLEIHFRSTSADQSQVPPFEIDWTLTGKLNSEWIPSFLAPSTVWLAPSFIRKSKALLDIHQFFIQYYYTW